MRAGLYRLRQGWRSPASGDQFLATAVVEITSIGTVVVRVGGEALFVFGSLEAFVGAHSVALADLEELTRLPQ